MSTILEIPGALHRLFCRSRHACAIWLGCVALVLPLLVWCGPGLAQERPEAAGDDASADRAPGPPTGPDSPAALLSADEVRFDQDAGIVVASGNVELARDARVLYADEVTYNQNTKVVTATGNIRLFEPSGDIVFADYAELTDDLRNAFIDGVGVLMTDGARMAANQAERTNGTFTRMNRGIYSPCGLCPENPDSPPLWQVRASRVVHDREDKEIRYANATIEFLGIPTFYTPYFSHPDPTVDRKSGFLSPVYGNSDDLGTFVRTGYYIDIAPEQDATVYLSMFSGETPLLAGQYRRRFATASLQVDGSITQSDFTDTESGQETIDPDRIRGHVFVDGVYDIDENWRSGLSVRASSDFSFLRQYYGFSGENFLTSRAYVENFSGRNYANVTGLRFQSLLANDTAQEPLVFPLAEYSVISKPGSLLGGRWSVDFGLRGVGRDDSGTDSTRFTVEPGWKRTLVSDIGLVADVTGRLRTDFYAFSDYVRPDVDGAGPESGTEYRILPEGQILARYPWTSQGEALEFLIEPIGAISFAPEVDTNDSFPNEDALDIEFSESNLFALNRFSGDDRQEGGLRLSYGLRLGAFGYGGKSAQLVVGQSYRLSDDEVFPTGSGLEEQRSDIVGSLDIDLESWASLYYGFRFDRSSLTPMRQVVRASGGLGILRTSFSYNFIDELTEGGTQVRSRQEFATYGVSSRLSNYWTASVSHNQSIDPDPGPRSTDLSLRYADECLIFDVLGTRDYTVQPGLNNGFSFYFRIVLRNIGEITSPVFTPGTFSGQGLSEQLNLSGDDDQ